MRNSMLRRSGALLCASFNAARRCGGVVALGVAALAALLAQPCVAEQLSPADSFEARFAAAVVTGKTEAVTTRADGSGGAGDKVASPGPIMPEPVMPSAPDAHSLYRALIEREARNAGLAPEIAEAVMAVESGYNPAAIGGAGEIGLMQILPSTARMLGFSGTLADLAAPETNIHYGVTYLAQAWRLAGEDLCTAVMKYRAGHGETRFSSLSVNYCLAVRSKLTAHGFRVTGDVPVATFGEPGPGRAGCGRKCLGAPRIGNVNIAALNMRLATLVVQARGGH